MRKTFELALKTEKYLAVRPSGKLHIIRFNGVKDPRESLLEEAKTILKEMQRK